MASLPPLHYAHYADAGIAHVTRDKFMDNYEFDSLRFNPAYAYTILHAAYSDDSSCTLHAAALPTTQNATPPGFTSPRVKRITLFTTAAQWSAAGSFSNHSNANAGFSGLWYGSICLLVELCTVALTTNRQNKTYTPYKSGMSSNQLAAEYCPLPTQQTRQHRSKVQAHTLLTSSRITTKQMQLPPTRGWLNHRSLL